MFLTTNVWIMQACALGRVRDPLQVGRRHWVDPYKSNLQGMTTGRQKGSMQPIAMADAGWLAWQAVRSRVPVVELLRTKGTQ